MNKYISDAANILVKREKPELVGAMGLFFHTLSETFEDSPLESILESYRGGVWGEEVFPGVGYPVLRSTNMRGMKVDVNAAAWCDIPSDQVDDCALRTGDILVTKSSGSTDLVGKAALFVHPGDQKIYLFSNFTLRLRPNSRRVLPEYIAWFLRSPQALAWRFDAQQNTVGLRNLQTKSYLQQIIPIPPLEIQQVVVAYLDALENNDPSLAQIVLPLSLAEQRRIVARIEELAAKIEAARGLRRETVVGAESLIGSTRARIFTEAAKKGTTHLDSLAILERGRFSHRPRNDPRFFGGDHPWIQIGEIESSNKYIQQWSQTLNDDGLAISRKFSKGTLLISIAATIGSVGILDFDCCIPDSIVAVTPKPGVDGEYLYHYLGYLRTHLEQAAPQSAQKNINLEILSPLPIPVLPLPEQRRIVAYLDSVQAKVDAVKALQAETEAELNALLPAVLDRAFKGEL